MISLTHVLNRLSSVALTLHFECIYILIQIKELTVNLS